MKPGPWYANKNDLIGGWAVGTAQGDVSSHPDCDDVADMITDEATARFIAAAPKLWAACGLAQHKIQQTLEGQYPGGQALRAALEVLTAAIDKEVLTTAIDKAQRKDDMPVDREEYYNRRAEEMP